MGNPSQTKVRAFTKSGDAPELALSIIGYLIKRCKQEGRQYCSFSVEKLPGSVNHMKPYKSHRLAEWVHVFRKDVKDSMFRSGIVWYPKGVTSAVVLMASPLWITKESKVRKFDADNRIKPIFDAIEHATGQPDENHWNFHVFKVPSKHEKLTVYLFDLGDVVEYYY